MTLFWLPRPAPRRSLLLLPCPCWSWSEGFWNIAAPELMQDCTVLYVIMWKAVLGRGTLRRKRPLIKVPRVGSFACDDLAALPPMAVPDYHRRCLI